MEYVALFLKKPKPWGLSLWHSSFSPVPLEAMNTNIQITEFTSRAEEAITRFVLDCLLDQCRNDPVMSSATKEEIDSRAKNILFTLTSGNSARGAFLAKVLLEDIQQVATNIAIPSQVLTGLLQILDSAAALWDLPFDDISNGRVE